MSSRTKTFKLYFPCVHKREECFVSYGLFALGFRQFPARRDSRGVAMVCLRSGLDPKSWQFD